MSTVSSPPDEPEEEKAPDPIARVDFSLFTPDPSRMSIMERIALLPEDEQMEALQGIDMEKARWNWDLWARPAQVPPKDDSWDVGLALAGRGFGKTRMAAEWIREKAKDTSQGPLRFLLVARTAAEVREVIVEGEALALDTKVATPLSPDGFLPIGKLKKGDPVIGGDGEVCRVTKVHPVLNDRECYAVQIEGQAEPIIADADHKWLVRYRYGHWGTGEISRKPVVKTTKEIVDDFDRRWYIDPVQVTGADLSHVLPFTPYNLGKILGTPPSRGFFTDHNTATREIPEIYFWASVEQRKELLRGFEDARRVIGPIFNYPGSYTDALRDSMHRLTSSLGFVSVHAKRDHPTNPYPYTEKWVRYRSKKHRAIQSITKVDSVPVRCIEVDSPDHTFLITESYIKTHNSGILAISPPDERPEYMPSIRRLVWPNGNQAICRSADEPDGLRGIQAHYSWGDEIAAWKQPNNPEELSAWDNLRIATRLGRKPQILATTTPRRVPLIFDLLEESKDPSTKTSIWLTRGSTFDNAGNLAGAYLNAITGKYDGTNMALQELYGEMLEAVEGALWDDEVIGDARLKEMPAKTPLRFVGVDPTVAEEPGDECGIIVVGSTNERDKYKRQAYVLEDASIKGAPSAWARRVVDTARRWGAPVVAEVNQGGALVRNAIHQIDPAIPVYDVRSKVGKKLRAEPITLAYQQGRVHHIGRLIKLEEQMVSWIPESTRKSPDRVDALVHALTALLIESPKGFSEGTVRAHNMANRQINLGGIRNRAPQGRITGVNRGGFRLGGNGR
ncbi:terminase [Microbacterium phage Pumpernickel]|uniref:Terminase n=1 Tax=Microbacterium phage Pumpernickel TaxID=2885983 RepID=A0AAE9C3D9_9CAUD|nr:terminase [Microbacterium phage Pumpernickel]UDL15866.1 terminase [Microbacterium phage Pumpernickel]